MYDMSFEEFDNEFYEAMDYFYDDIVASQLNAIEEMLDNMADLDIIAFEYEEMEEIPFFLKK